MIDTLLVAIGGGGLITGIATAAKALKPTIRVVGIEPVGAPTLKAAIDADAIVTLDKVDTAAVTLAAGRTEPLNFAAVRQHVDEIVLVTDDEMARSCALAVVGVRDRGRSWSAGPQALRRSGAGR